MKLSFFGTRENDMIPKTPITLKIMDKLTRRNFLKTAAIGALTTAAGLPAISALAGEKDKGRSRKNAPGKDASYSYSRRIPVQSGYDVIVAG